ncbi:GAF domain-containing protein [Nucisporomicrobium flavum]|uniref:GAF domain-containing protein n=1 Tax=Nucisporomicrobium flavum TaxID=2785915 RepID=UPI0018F41E8F|nr:GAF domain-containing protein [Nucisporomicrobium flavum]
MSDTDDLSFPHAARLEFDEILERLVASAREVQATQGRLRGLLRAYLAIARADDLDDVLRHVVDAAKVLVRARYAALGVVSHGGLVRFIHSGIDEDTARRIGHLPQGKGMLGLLVDDPRPVRLRDICGHPASVGFPAGHPRMTSFLGVPVRVGDRVFGNLYLTDKQGGAAFTADDEELVLALAAAAGVSIENATLLAQGRRRQAWQSAMVEATNALLADADPDVALLQFVTSAQETLGGTGAAAAVPADDDTTLRVAVGVGMYGRYTGTVIRLEDSIVGDAVQLTAPVAGDRSRLPQGWPARRDTAIGACLAAPMLADRRLVGVLLVSRSPDDGAFDELDHDILAGAAGQAGLALRLAEARHDSERLRMLEDREHLAADLRDRVIQRLFRHGLALQCAAARVGTGEPRQRLQDQIDEVDAIIRDIRDTVLSLERG